MQKEELIYLLDQYAIHAPISIQHFCQINNINFIEHLDKGDATLLSKILADFATFRYAYAVSMIQAREQSHKELRTQGKIDS